MVALMIVNTWKQRENGNDGMDIIIHGKLSEICCHLIDSQFKLRDEAPIHLALSFVCPPHVCRTNGYKFDLNLGDWIGVCKTCGKEWVAKD